MQLTSTAFQNNDLIPAKYTCDGENINPPLTFSQTPKEAASLVLTVTDIDAPKWSLTHWLLYNIPASTMQILEKETPDNTRVGMNDFTHTGYDGPCPPSGTHRYVFKLYALNTTLNLPVDCSRDQVEKAMKDHIIAETELVGRYTRE